MSSIVEINANDYVSRFVEMFRNSAFLFPKTIGLDKTAEDLVKQVIEYDLAVPQDTVTGEGPPHIYVTSAPNFIVEDVQSGRDLRDEKGPRDVQVELWAVCFVNDPEFADSQNHLLDITQAVKQTAGKNQRMLDSGGANPISQSMEYKSTPFTDFPTTEKNMMAQTVVLRPKVRVNLRSS